MKIICTNFNYKSQIAELSHPTPKVPLFFLRPDTSILLKNRPFFLPDFSQNIQCEAELVVKINKVGKYIQERFAHTYYNEVGLGVSFTARDLLKQCQEKGEPWEIAKCFDNSAAVSNFVSLSDLPPVDNLDFQLRINEKQIQHGNTADMLFLVNNLIVYISQFITLKIGDLLFTGTTQGVKKLKINDHIEAYLENKKLLDFYVR